MNFRVFLVRWCWLTLFFVGLSSAAPANAQIYKGVELVKADLLADTTAITPGKPFIVGLRLKMALHWHTYWQNSGDAGLPTKIAWTLPEGFQAGPLQWPLPDKIESSGDILNYGYSTEIVLLTQITPPAQLPSGAEISLKAKADWLVCAELCVPGSKNLELKLPAGGEPQAANQKVFAEYAARLPRPAGENVSLTRNVNGGNVLFAFRAATPAGEKYGIDFFPLPPGDLEVGHPEISSVVNDDKGTAANFKIPVPSDVAKAAKMGGLLVLTSADNDRMGYLIEAQSSAEPTAGKGFAPVVASATPQKRASGSGNATAGTNAAAQPTGSLGYFLLLGFLGGLILNVMPCVLPVISLKIFSFIRQANDAPECIFKMGLAYAAGVFAWFLGFAALVVILKSGGREVGYAFHLQNPWFIVGLSAAVFVFALNLLGVFEFVLPSAAAGALAGASQHREGYLGAFLQGVLATVLGSACTAPFFGAALGFAFSQSALIIFAMFAAFAAGMSAPFVLLTAFPAWLRFLPKPGVWMERVKQATGFLMLATLLWLLSVLGAMRGSDAVVWTGVLLLALGIACWVQGTFNTLMASGGVRTAAWIAMLALVAGGAWLSLPQIASARLPAASERAEDFPARLQATLQNGSQPVFVDFTAAWCISCKLNERNVLSTKPVQQALKDANAVFLTADYTNYEPAITALLKKFKRAGVPLYVIYPADRSRQPIVLPELITQGIVLDGLRSATGTDRKNPDEKLASSH